MKVIGGVLNDKLVCILKFVCQVGRGGMDWLDLAQDRDRRRALVNAVLNLRLHKMRGTFLRAETC
jgi:hypothetical protein